ncbi:MAG: RES family NAD+ phosphorylase [Alphaproteobacteria bacterium]
MPLVWRLARPEFAEHLDGEGSRIEGGRWNPIGLPALYTSELLSLSVLEVHVHLPPQMRDALPVLRAVQISIPDMIGITRVSVERLAELLAADDPLAVCQAVGEAWISRGRDLVFQVPSVLVPEETNLILNPAHPRMREVKIVSSRPFHFDRVLLCGRPEPHHSPFFSHCSCGIGSPTW